MIDMKKLPDVLMPGACVMYRPEYADSEVPHLVLAEQGDLLCVKPLHVVTRDRGGATMVARGQCRPLRVVERVTRPVLELTLRQLHFVQLALEAYDAAARNGEHVPEQDEFCAIHNAKNIIADYLKLRKEVK